jgi:hypothetical protein
LSVAKIGHAEFPPPGTREEAEATLADFRKAGAMAAKVSPEGRRKPNCEASEHDRI